jgi:hypothetical protein
MNRQRNVFHGTLQLEELLRALNGLHDMLPVERQEGMNAREVEGLFFLMKELLQRLADILDLLLQEQAHERQPQP